MALWKKMRKRLQTQRKTVIVVQKIMLQFQVDSSLQMGTDEVDKAVKTLNLSRLICFVKMRQ